MAYAYRLTRHTPAIGSAKYGHGWDLFNCEEIQNFSLDAGVQTLKNGIVIGGYSANVGVGSAGERYNNVVSEPLDTVMDWRARCAGSVSCNGIKVSSLEGFKSFANAATMPAPGSSAVGITTATITTNGYTPNVVESTYTVSLYYKRTTDPSYTLAGTDTANPFSVNLTGLDPATQYQFYAIINRTTANATSAQSSTETFTTLAAEPDVTTQAATAVDAGVAGVPADGHATLNGNVDRNEKTDTEWRFAYGTSSGVYTIFTAWTATTVEPETVQSVASGLSESATYFFRLEVRWNSGTQTKNGSELSFTVPVDPLADAAAEDHVFIREFNERKYGVASKFIVPVASPAATSSDRYFNAASPFVAGDVKVAQDTGSGLGAFANVATLPVRIGTSPAFELSLSATEMQGVTVIVSIVDQDGPAFRDQMVVIRTRQELGNMDLDASQLSNVSAFKATGQGSGHGIEAIGGATGQDINGIMSELVLRSGTAQAHGVAAEIKLDASANANDDYYNGALVMLIAGTGVGQSRVMVDYTGSTKVAVVDSSWVVNPDATSVFIIIPGSRPWDLYRGELSALPADNANYGAKLQLMFQRFAFKIDQTATVQQLYKADNTTVLTSRSVSDAAGVQTIGKLS